MNFKKIKEINNKKQLNTGIIYNKKNNLKKKKF